MKYLIAGTGGVGGSIAGFLSLAGKDVTCIASDKNPAILPPTPPVPAMRYFMLLAN